MGDENPIRTLGDYSEPSHEGYRNTIELPVGNNLNDPRDFAKPVKAIALPQDVPSTFECCLIELETQVQCEICSNPYDTQYCMEDPEQAFVEYASSRTNEVGGLVSNFMASLDARLSKFEADFKQQQSDMTNKIDIVLKAITDRIAGTLPSDTVKNLKLSTTLVLSARDDGEVLFIEIIRDGDEPRKEGPNEGEGAATEEPTVEYFDTLSTRNELTYHRMLQVVLGKPFVEISNIAHDPQEGVVRFTNGNDEVAYKIPHKLEQYNSLSNLEKEHTKSIYLRNEEAKRRGVEYVMSKILGFYKECLELGPEYLTRLDDEGEVT
ncbi:hypothetical protein Tco_0366655 [Tanacetum coccineum]